LVQKFSQATLSVLGSYARDLEPGEKNWFRVVGSAPVIRDARVSAWPFAGIVFLGALFVSFWGVFLWHFLEPLRKKNKKKQ
jgi:hypothetical protein